MQSGREGPEFKKLKWQMQPRKPGQPTKRWGHTTVVHDGRLLVFGGNHQGVTREGVYKVDCQTLEGDALNLAVQPQMRQSHSCTLYHDCLYIYGGCINQELTNDLIQVKLTGPNPSWRKLEQKNPIPPRESHLAVLLHKKFILIYGGSTPEENFLDEFWLLDLQSIAWHQVKDIKGKLEARIGATMTPFGNQIYSFGGEWGDSEESQYSNDISKLRFQGDLKGEQIPCLSISKLQVSGTRPNPRTGHSSVDYKGKMLIIVGGEGQRTKKSSVLYNDIWGFDIRTLSWSELIVENRTSFRPRANFTANIYKNTIYIFGGFVNLASFRCTDQLITLTLSEHKHSHRQENEHRSMTQIETQNNNLPQYCSQCKFQFLPQQRQPVHLPEQRILNGNVLVASTQNIIHAARSISSPLEGLGLIIHAITLIAPHTNKQIYIDLVNEIVSTQSQQFSGFMDKEYLRFSVTGLGLGKEQLQNLAFSYKCQPNDQGFDLKNGLFRLGRQVLICELFEDGMLHSYLLTNQGIYRSVLHLQTIFYQLERVQNRPLSYFLKHNKIKLVDFQPSEVRFYVGSLVRQEDKSLQLKVYQKDFMHNNSQKCVFFKQFIKDYFLNEKSVTLTVNGVVTSLISYENLLRNHSTQREQQPTTKYFSKVHLVINEHEQFINPPSAFIKLFALGRRVGVYNKFPFISGFLQLNDISSLNYPRTRCDSWQIRAALEEQIRSLLEQSRKRESDVPLSQLHGQIMN